MHVLDTLAPVFAVIALGAALRRTGFVSDELLRGLNRVVYWVALPALLFGKIATAPEIGSFWFLAFDGGSEPQNACALLAEERSPEAFYGFWTYDEDLVGAIEAYLSSTYGR